MTSPSLARVESLIGRSIGTKAFVQNTLWYSIASGQPCPAAPTLSSLRQRLISKLGVCGSSNHERFQRWLERHSDSMSAAQPPRPHGSTRSSTSSATSRRTAPCECLPRPETVNHRHRRIHRRAQSGPKPFIWTAKDELTAVGGTWNRNGDILIGALEQLLRYPTRAERFRSSPSMTT